MTDIAGMALAAAGMATSISSPDYAALGVAAIGATIGGFLSVAATPASFQETRRTAAIKWGVSSLASIAFTPWLFQNAVHHPVQTAGVTIPVANTAEAMLALSTAVACVAWVTIQLAQLAYAKWLKKKLEIQG